MNRPTLVFAIAYTAAAVILPFLTMQGGASRFGFVIGAICVGSAAVVWLVIAELEEMRRG